MKRFIVFLSLVFCSVAHADTETINWYMDDNIYATTTCESGGDITLPTAPTKYGYTFQGWSVYTPIEYLESTGTQYIDTEFIPNQDTGVKTKIKFLDSYATCFGSGTSYTGTNFEFYTNTTSSSTQGQLEFNYDGYRFGQNITVNDIIEINWNKEYIIYSINNGNVKNISFSYHNFSSPYNMFLFGNKRPSQITSHGRKRIYYFQIYDNNTLVRDFVPALDGNGVPCMYDRVEKKFYYNAGTGDFIAGPIVGE